MPRSARQPEEAIGPWNVMEDAYPAGASLERRLWHFLRYAVLAPSGHNTQPWRFRIREGAIELRADRSRALPVADPESRELTVSCGAALLNLRVAMLRYGLEPVVEAFPERGDPDLLARVHPGPAVEPMADDVDLFAAIPRRRTVRGRYEKRQVPAHVVEQLVAEARCEGARLRVLRSGERDAFAELVEEGDRVQGADPAFRRELAEWVHANRSSRPDGIPGVAFMGAGNVASHGVPLLLRAVNWGRNVGARDRRLAGETPLVAVLTTSPDEPPEWLAAGQALERVLLRATHLGLAASYLNQAIQVPYLRTRLRDALGERGWPQVGLRVGYPEAGAAPAPTPRRSVDDVLEA